MTTSTFAQRTAELTAIWRDNRWLYLLAGLLIGILVTPAVERLNADFFTLLGDLVPEAVGILITVTVIEGFARRARRQETIKRIVREMRSPNVGDSGRAIREARELRILMDGTLSGADLRHADLSRARLWNTNLSGADLRHADLSRAGLSIANLSRAVLSGANLSGAVLSGANLSGADLRRANLSGAGLWNTNLSGADMGLANLSGANLEAANLSGAVLSGANLSGADLRHADLSEANLGLANLSGAVLRDVTFDVETTLPDDTKWVADTDVARFTDHNHLDSWLPRYAAAGLDTLQEWWDANYPRPWLDAGYDENEWNEWVRDGKPAQKPTDDTES